MRGANVHGGGCGIVDLVHCLQIGIGVSGGCYDRLRRCVDSGS